MAGLGYKSFSAGDVLTAAQVQGYLQDQAVMRFADSTARASAIGTANFTEGMISYLDNTNQVEYYSGSTWASIAPVSTQGLTLLNTTSFSGVSSVSAPNSTFNATYDNYVVRFNDITFSSTASYANVRMRAAGSDYSGAEYRQQFFQSNSTTLTGARSTGTSWDGIAYGTTGMSFCAMEIQSPYLAKVTQTQWFTNFDTTTNIIGFQKSASVNTTTSYDSLTIISQTGTISGSMSIYGFNK